MLSKRDNHEFKKRQGRTILQMSLEMHHTQVNFILIKESQNKIKFDEKKL